MKLFFKVLFAVLILQLHVNAQDATHFSTVKNGYGLSHRFFFYWGYNRAIYSKSDIHLSGPDYDFTVFDVIAHDRPSPFTFKEYFGPTSWTVPQYNYRIGYYFNDHFSISLGQDHMKYVMDRDQVVKVSGIVSSLASEQYAGAYLESSTKLSPDFLTYEHTDGLNLFSLDFEYTLPLVSFFEKKLVIDLNSGIGGIWMVPRTDVRVFGYGLNNRYHLAGYAMTVKSGPQVRFFQHYFIRAQSRIGYVTLPDVLIHNDVTDRADQNFSFMEWYVVAGVIVPFKKFGR